LADVLILGRGCKKRGKTSAFTGFRGFNVIPTGNLSKMHQSAQKNNQAVEEDSSTARLCIIP
jgi:hypothetical protein